MPTRLRFVLATACVLAFSFFSSLAYGQATVSTDQLDYPPGSTAIITGSGFQPGETVTLRVIHVGDDGDNATSPDHQPWTVTADSLGNISSSWYVPSDQDELGATLLLTADGQTSLLHAEETFTDAAVNVTTQPASGTICEGSPYTFTSVADQKNLTGNWQIFFGGVWQNVTTSNVPSPTGFTVSSGNSGNSTTTSLALTTVGSGLDGFQFRVQFIQGTNNVQATSNAATLT